MVGHPGLEPGANGLRTQIEASRSPVSRGVSRKALGPEGVDEGQINPLSGYGIPKEIIALAESILDDEGDNSRAALQLAVWVLERAGGR